MCRCIYEVCICVGVLYEVCMCVGVYMRCAYV